MRVEDGKAHKIPLKVPIVGAGNPLFIYSRLGRTPIVILNNPMKTRVSSGMELALLDVFFLRMGISYTPARWTNQRFCSAGFGIHLNGLGVDFAYLLPYESYSPIANTIRVGVSLRK